MRAVIEFLRGLPRRAGYDTVVRGGGFWMDTDWFVELESVNETSPRRT